MSDPAPRIHLLLTATVDVAGIVSMRRVDPGIRRRDYQTALAWWDSLGEGIAPDTITVCENSGSDIPPPNGGTWRRIKTMCWNGQDFDRSLGKGFGEMRTLTTAIERLAPEWSARDWVIKCNGRYRIPSVGKFCRHLRQLPDTDLVADLTRDLAWCDSRFFAARLDCWQNHLLPTLARINETAGNCFEQALATAAHGLMAQGGRFALLPFVPRILGASGSKGYNYGSPRAALRFALKKLLYPLKRAAFRV